MNDFDFFDSDGISKSKTGQVVKLTALALPFFIPVVGEAYGYAMASVLAAEALSIFGKIGIDAVSDVTEDSKKSDAWQFLNKIDAFGKSYGKSMTEEGKSSIWSFEQATNVIGDIFLQLAQQNAIAKLGKYATNAKRAAYAHTLINIIGVCWVIPIFPFYLTFLSKISNVNHIPTAIATAHTTFNILNVCFFVPFGSSPL